ncbi:PAAR domain-containing protein [Serratia sp. T13T92]|jgi:uncharacterized Zn-binding protein involved in type VI secretion|uniref:PAAR domain-containing protein n=1 Tax=Serratia sp. T13T92 TaxID=3397496 RepID=UPI0039E00C7D
MEQPAARISDMHACPMVSPGLYPIPHVGGPIIAPGVSTVLIEGIPAATVGSLAVCTGPQDSIVKGSTKVLIGNKPAARMGDACAHGGIITTGSTHVLLG